MKKTIECEVHCCDGCGEETYVNKCFNCEVEYCWECEKKLMVEYKSGVWHSGRDGHYCLNCDNKLLAARNNPLHETYVRIKYLRMENKTWYDEFTTRASAAENKLKELLDERKADL